MTSGKMWRPTITRERHPDHVTVVQNLYRGGVTRAISFFGLVSNHLPQIHLWIDDPGGTGSDCLEMTFIGREVQRCANRAEWTRIR